MVTAPLIASNIAKNNFAGHGKEAAEQYMCDIELAIAAMNYVSEFAIDQVRFVSLGDAIYEAALEKLRKMGSIK